MHLSNMTDSHFKGQANGIYMSRRSARRNTSASGWGAVGIVPVPVEVGRFIFLGSKGLVLVNIVIG